MDFLVNAKWKKNKLTHDSVTWFSDKFKNPQAKKFFFLENEKSALSIFLLSQGLLNNTFMPIFPILTFMRKIREWNTYKFSKKLPLWGQLFSYYSRFHGRMQILWIVFEKYSDRKYLQYINVIWLEVCPLK